MRRVLDHRGSLDRSVIGCGGDGARLLSASEDNNAVVVTGMEVSETPGQSIAMGLSPASMAAADPPPAALLSVPATTAVSLLVSSRPSALSRVDVIRKWREDPLP
jgi:hypothetical protein